MAKQIVVHFYNEVAYRKRNKLKITTSTWMNIKNNCKQYEFNFFVK